MKELSIAKIYEESNGLSEYDTNIAIEQKLNAPVPQKWLKEHPYAKIKLKGKSVPAKYLSIERVEWWLTFCFPAWWVEVLKKEMMANSVAVSVRLHVVWPDGSVRFQDGVGAAAIQVNSGASATDWTQIKASGVQMALPAAKSYAIKDAAKHFGKSFGRGLNRENLNWEQATGNFSEATVISADDLDTQLGSCETVKELNTIYDNLSEKQRTSKVLLGVYSKHKKRINEQ